MGQLCDQINASNSGAPNWHCTLVSAIRSDVAANTLPVVPTVTAANNSAAAPGGYNLFFGSNTIMSLGIIPAPQKHVILAGCFVNAGGTIGSATNAPPFAIYGVPVKYGRMRDPYGAVLNDSNQVLIQSLTSGTSYYIPATYQYANTPFMEFGPLAGNPGFGGTGNIQYGPSNATQYNGKVVVRVGALQSGASALGNNPSNNFLQCSWWER
jgi:hypothetical protein